MTYYSKYVTKDLVASAKKELINLGQFSMLPIKLKAISACENNQIKDVASIIGFSKRSLTSWIKIFKDKGVEGLLNKSGRGRKSLFDDKIKGSLRIAVMSNPNITLKELSLMIIKKHQLTISKSAIHNHLKKIGYSHITSRPKHYQQDKEKLEHFKKNSN